VSARVHPYHGYLNITNHPVYRGPTDHVDTFSCPYCDAHEFDIETSGGLIAGFLTSERCHCNKCGEDFVRYYVEGWLAEELRPWFVDTAGRLLRGKYGKTPSYLPCRCGGWMAFQVVDPKGNVKVPGDPCPLTGAPGLLVMVRHWRPSKSDILRWTCESCGEVQKEKRDPDPEEPPKMRVLKTKWCPGPAENLTFVDSEIKVEGDKASCSPVREDYFGHVILKDLVDEDD